MAEISVVHKFVWIESRGEGDGDEVDGDMEAAVEAYEDEGEEIKAFRPNHLAGGHCDTHIAISMEESFYDSTNQSHVGI